MTFPCASFLLGWSVVSPSIVCLFVSVRSFVDVIVSSISTLAVLCNTSLADLKEVVHNHYMDMWFNILQQV